jgi:hypothetical protein
MSTVYLTFNKQTIGQLDSHQYISVDGASVKADLFYVFYKLSLNKNLIEGDFMDKYLLHDSVLFITAIDVAITEKETGVLKGTRLLAINLETLIVTQLSQLEKGYVYPKEMEGDKIVYTKQLLNSSAIKEFDQSIHHLIK